MKPPHDDAPKASEELVESHETEEGAPFHDPMNLVAVAAVVAGVGTHEATAGCRIGDHTWVGTFAVAAAVVGAGSPFPFLGPFALALSADTSPPLASADTDAEARKEGEKHDRVGMFVYREEASDIQQFEDHGDPLAWELEGSHDEDHNLATTAEVEEGHAHDLSRRSTRQEVELDGMKDHVAIFHVLCDDPCHYARGQA